MKLQVTQENLTKALGNVSRIAITRGTLPILSNILIKTTNNRLSIAATNLDVAITQYIGAKVEQEGSITVPARLMQDFVASLPSSVIELKLEDNKLHISTDRYKSVINGVPADDFPVMPAISNGQTLKLGGKTLKSGLNQVVVAASNDESRPVLTGVYIHTFNGQLFLVATDSYRLAEKGLIKLKTDVQMLIPAGAIQDLLRIVGDEEDEVEIVHDDQQVLFKVGEIELVTRQIEGNYPDYRKLIPTNFANTAKLKRAELTNVTKVSSLFARENAGSVTIDLDKKANQLSIHSIASQLGENVASATAEVSTDSTITLNSRYILDALNCLNGEDVVFAFNGKLEPCVLKDPKSTDYLHVIMPLKS
ncbi:MAG TPA: DNA polymerase III subunit beta [Candidatus Saccharimonadales bacterium]|nr:DNA polymerase III subunit beta [Candidatus Saccharimonadales bacterium]